MVGVLRRLLPVGLVLAAVACSGGEDDAVPDPAAAPEEAEDDTTAVADQPTDDHGAMSTGPGALQATALVDGVEYRFLLECFGEGQSFTLTGSHDDHDWQLAGIVTEDPDQSMLSLVSEVEGRDLMVSQGHDLGGFETFEREPGQLRTDAAFGSSDGGDSAAVSLHLDCTSDDTSDDTSAAGEDESPEDGANAAGGSYEGIDVGTVMVELDGESITFDVLHCDGSARQFYVRGESTTAPYAVNGYFRSRSGETRGSIDIHEPEGGMLGPVRWTIDTTRGFLDVEMDEAGWRASGTGEFAAVDGSSSAPTRVVVACR